MEGNFNINTKYKINVFDKMRHNIKCHITIYYNGALTI